MAGADPKVALIETVPMFCRLGRHEREQVAQLLDEVDVPAGRVLMRQGDTGREMFVVVSGRFGIDRDGRQIAERGAGSVLGEMSLISEGPRTATVTAIEPSTVLVAGHREFHALMDDHPAIRMQVLEGLAEKIRNVESDGLH
jgi:CRP/FNR family transcriptional regulator, cyclic AMP receptor protein